ncbi:hypothetical protein S40288_09234 [Stachybotrys chartarum IBT 40288]|nr:hypothetical protein S40288_09234 [Stachybotrys chartarum IBT 40288]
MAKGIKDIRKIVIVGAGPAGLLAALCLRRTHEHITPVLYEIRNAPGQIGGALGIPANGFKLLHKLGLYDDMVAKGALTSSMALHSLDGRSLGELDLAAWSKKHTGFGYLRILRTNIMKVLLTAAEQARIPVHYGKAPTSIQEKDEQVIIKLSDGTSDTADFLIGCDGIHSAVRSLYVDPDTTPEYTGISNMFSVVPSAHLTHFRGLPNSLHATITPDGLFALSPTSPTSDVLYWFFSREVPLPEGGNARHGWEAQGKKEVESCKGNLLQLFEGEKSEWVDMLRETIDRTKLIRFYPIYKLPTGGSWFKGRCLVIGDAAHAMPPHASQGISMALEEAFLFSKLLQSEAPVIEEAMVAYVKKRTIRTEEILRTAERNGGVRRKKAPWRTRADEAAISCMLWVYRVAGLDRLGYGQKFATYDVEAEEF